MTLAADIRVGCWSLTITTGSDAIAGACAAPGFAAELAAATLAPALGPLDPGGAEIVAIDRLVLPPLELGAAGNAAALAEHVARVCQAVRTVPATRRFRDGRAAIRAMLHAEARGQGGDLWLWRALGLIGADDAREAIIARGLAALAATGPRAWPVLQSLATAGDLARLWPRAPIPVLHTLADALAPEDDAVAVAEAGLSAAVRRHLRPPASPALARRLLAQNAPAWIALPARGAPARARLAARLALAAAGARALPAAEGARLLASAEAHFLDAGPAAGANPQAAGSRVGSAARLAPVAAPAAGGPATAGPPAAPGARPDPAPARPAGLRRPAPPAPDREEEPDRPLATTGAGLLFLLPLMPEAGLFETPARTLMARGGLVAALVRIAAEGFGMSLADPVVRAFAGLWPGRLPGDDDPARPLPRPPCSAAQRQAVGRIVAGTVAAIGRRGGRDLAPARIVARPGRLALAPAETDLHMPLGAVDIDIRRAGLDAAPGFIPWHGCIVRFHYENG